MENLGERTFAELCLLEEINSFRLQQVGSLWSFTHLFHSEKKVTRVIKFLIRNKLRSQWIPESKHRRLMREKNTNG